MDLREDRRLSGFLMQSSEIRTIFDDCVIFFYKEKEHDFLCKAIGFF